MTRMPYMGLLRWLAEVSRVSQAGAARRFFDDFSGSENCQTASEGVLELFGSSMTVVGGASMEGRTRPAPYKGHEHFGFMDGISQPAVR